MSDMEEARRAMIAKRFGGNAKGASTGDAGAARRKKKGSSKSGGDDKRLGSVLKKLGLTDLKGVEEVNLIRDDGYVIHILAPKIQASVPANTYVISGQSDTRKIEDLLPGIMAQLGPESMEYLRTYAENVQEPGSAVVEEEDEDDDEVPDLVENFEEAAAK